ncbi:MAG: hypothetical protein KF690_04990 [Bacteroidetes bacterium]|nr:hypothetical protein [Bacteroidota bacterium]
MLKTLLLLLTAILFTGCATILSGNRNAIHVKNGTPANAKVYYNGNYIGTAPCKVRADKQCKPQTDCHIEIRATGYEPQRVKIHRKLSYGWLFADVVCGVVIPLAVDFGTSAIYKPRPNKVWYNLEPKP